MAEIDPFADYVPAAQRVPQAAPAEADPFADHTPRSSSPPPAQGKPDAAPSKSWGFREYATDGVRSLISGVAKGATALAGLPADIVRAGQAGLDYSQSVGEGRSFADVSKENRIKPAFPLSGSGAEMVAAGLEAAGGENLHAQSGLAYKPQSRAGKFISAAADFGTQAAALPLGGGGLLARTLVQGVAPGLVSEGAGQITEGSAAEPYARLLGALAPVGVAAVAQAPSAAQRAAVNAAREIPAAEMDQILTAAQRLIDDAAANGTKLSTFQAVDAASGGRVNLSELQRHAEGMGRLRSFFADIGDRNREAAGRQFSAVGEARADASAVGGEIAEAARAGVAATPEGRTLARAQTDLGPRVEAREAGEAMQAGLAQTRAEREAARAAETGPLYREAENAPERIGIDRQIEVERRGDLGLVTRDGDPAATPRFSTEGPALDPAARTGVAAADDGPRPVSLARFVAQNGGVTLAGGEAKFSGLDRWNIPGVGKVAGEGGKSIDNFWREKLIGPDGYFAGETAEGVGDRLMAALAEERAGRPTFRPADQARAERLGLTKPTREAEQLAEARSAASSYLDEDLLRAGIKASETTPEVRTRAIDYLAGGTERDPLTAYERAANELREPPLRRPATTEERGSNVTERISAPRFGQVNPTAAAAHVDEAIAMGAKGKIADKLREVRGLLNDSTGELDLTTRGLMGADQAIGDLIGEAKASGNAALARVLTRAKGALKDAMETSTPEVSAANRAYERTSRFLDNFDDARPAGKITARDEFDRRFVVDPENVPAQIKGSTGAREFNDLATPQARSAYQGRLLTESMDAAGGAGATGEAIRGQIARDFDRLREHPEVLARLNARAEADEGLAAIRATPLGRLAEGNRDVAEAVGVLFPKGEAAEAVGAAEIGRAVSAVAATNPRAAGTLVRTKLEGAFNTVARDVNTAGGQMGASKFRNAIYGNTKEAANLRAAVEALPDGRTILDGLDRLFDVFQAQGLRQNVGSKTAYNQEFLQEAARGGTVEGIAKAAVNPVKLPSRFGKMIEEWRLGRNMDQIAAMATNPDAQAAFRGLLRSGDISGPVGRLATIAARSQGSPALQIRVQPRSED